MYNISKKSCCLLVVVMVLFVVFLCVATLSPTAIQSQSGVAFAEDATITAASGFASGNGSSSSPYAITTIEEYAYFANKVESNSSICYQLQNDLDFSGYIVPQVTALWSNFDGNGKTITVDNLTSSLFGYADLNATISNLIVQGTASSNVVLVGQSYGTVSNIITDVAMTVDSTSEYVSAIVGKNYGTVSNSVNMGNITASTSNAAIGGIVAQNYATIKSCVNSGTITSSGSGCSIGGITGEITNSNYSIAIEYCMNLSDVLDLGSENNCGALVGAIPNAATVVSLQYSYYYNEAELSTIYAVGYAASTGGGYNISTTGGNQFKGVNGTTLTSSTVNTLFSAYGGSYYTKQTSAYTGAAYYAPVVSSLSSVSTAAGTLAKDASTIKLYGTLDTADSNYVWGTAENPYTIDDTDMYAQLAISVNSGYSYNGSYFVQTADLDFYGEEVSSIGDGDFEFAGNYNGGMYTLSNISISKVDDSSVGIFGYITGKVSNLIIDDSCVIEGSTYVGSLVGKLSGSISNIWSKATVYGASNIGGIIGQSINGSTNTVLFTGDVFATLQGGVPYGIVGQTQGFSFTNTWFLTSDDKQCQSTNQSGNLIYVDINGSIDVQLTEDKNDFEFVATADSGFSAEYRLLDETLVCASLDKTGTNLSNNTTSGKTVYVRFVKELSYGAIGGSTTVLGNYYYGQSVSISCTIASGYYLTYVYGEDDDTSTPISGVWYSYLEASNQAVVTFTWSASMAEMTAFYIGFSNVSATNQTTEYNGSTQSYEYTALTGYTYTAAASGITRNVGTYTINVSVYGEDDNVKRGYQTVTYTITPIYISIDESMVDLVKEFDDSTLAVATEMISYPEQIIAGDAVVISALIAFTTTAIGTNKTATVDFSMSGSDSTNYTLLTTSINTVNAEIIKKTIVFEIASSELTKVYDGRDALITNYGIVDGYAAVSGYPIYEYITVQSAISGSLLSNVGEYIVSITFDGNEITEQYVSSNYYIIELKETYTYTITPYETTVVIMSTSQTYTGTAKTLSATYLDMNGNTITTTTGSEAKILEMYVYDAESGEYIITDSLMAAGEYMVYVGLDSNYCTDTTYYDLENNINGCYFTIEKATQPSIGFEIAGTFTFGDEAITLTATASNDDDINGDTIYFEVMSGYGTIAGNILTFIGAGEITIRAIMPASTNYNEGYAEVVISVDYLAIELSVSQTEYSIKYGEAFVLAYVYGELEAEPIDFIAPSITYYDIEDSSFSNGYTDITLLNVGTYQVVFGDDATSAGYVVTTNISGVTLEIVAQDIVITASSYEVVYGDSEITEFEYTTDIEGDTVVITLTRELGSDAGTYAIIAQASLVEDNVNYNITFIAGEYVITARAITLIMDYTTKVYGTEDPTQTYTVTNLVDGEDEPFTVEFTRTAGENVGSYIARASITLTSGNYTISYQSAELKITQATPEVDVNEFGEINIEYAYPMSTVVPKVEGEYNYMGETVSVSGTLVWVDGSVAMEASGYYDAIFTPSSSNYNTVEVTVYVTIIARELEVVFDYEKSITYSGFEMTPVTYTIKNILDGDDVGDILTYSATVKNVGEYTATVSISNTSYVLVGDTSVTFNVTQADLTIYLEDIVVSQVETPVAAYKYVGFLGSDTEEVLTTQPQVEFATEVGNYEITPYGAAADNYNISYLTSKFTVAKTILDTDTMEFTMSGYFDFLMEVELSELYSNENSALFSEYEAAYEALKAGTTYSNTELQNVYAITYTIDGEVVELTDTGVATVLIPNSIREAKDIAVVLIMADGSMVYAENITRDGNYVTFDMENCVAFAYATKPDYTVVIIVIVVVVLVMMVFILDAVTEKMGVGRHKNKKKNKNSKKDAK